MSLGTAENIAQRGRAGTYTHVYGATCIRIAVQPNDPGYDARSGFENDDYSGEPEFRGFAPSQRRSCRTAASRSEMFSQILTRRYPGVFRDPVDLDFADATADIDHMFGHEF